MGSRVRVLPALRALPTLPALRTLAAVAAVLTLGVLATAAPAAAHVTVDPDGADPGGYARVAFRVPNERPDAATVEVEVHLPEEAPLASVSVRPVPGWSVEMQQRELDEPVDTGHGSVEQVVSVITWTAEEADAALSPGRFGEFPISIGPLPEADALPEGGVLLFRTLQTYDDGEVVRWIDPPDPDGSAPPHPAPVLRLTGAADGASGGTGPGDAGPKATAAGAEPDNGDASGGPGWWSGAALVAGAGGLALGGLALARTRRSGGARGSP